MTGPRVHSWYLGATLHRSLVVNYSSGHLHDPANENRIMLYVASRVAVYEAYAEDFVSGRSQLFPAHRSGTAFLPSQSYFLRIWRTTQSLQHIVLRKFLKFSVCSECVKFREQRRLSKSPQERLQINAEAKVHHQYVNEERASYYWRRLQSITQPRDYLSIIIDGADQAAFALPHFLCKDKTSASALKIPVHLMGALVHGRAAYAFTYLNNIKHGTNLVLECLNDIFMDLMAEHGELPLVLCLQLDNTAKQNKNQFLIGFAACLVQWRIFQKVIVSFLPVGHTHEDIDQMFSRISGYLRRHDALDRGDFTGCAKWLPPEME